MAGRRHSLFGGLLRSTKAITEEWGAFSATILHQFAERHLAGTEVHAERRHCRVVDVFAGKVFEAPESFKRGAKMWRPRVGILRAFGTPLPLQSEAGVGLARTHILIGVDDVKVETPLCDGLVIW